MVEIPKAPKIDVDWLDAVPHRRHIEAVNELIRDAWSKLFEGAEVRYGTDPEESHWTSKRTPFDTHQAILLKPVPIKKPGVTRAEIKALIGKDVTHPVTTADLLQRILDEGLAE